MQCITRSTTSSIMCSMIRLSTSMFKLWYGQQISIKISLVIAWACLLNCSAFLLVDNCPAPSPCTCSGSSSYSYIHCYSKSLKDIPHFRHASGHVSTLNVGLYSNSITVVPGNAFSNLSSIHATSIILYLHSNHINNISDNAFNGIANATTTLWLSFNNLTTIPSAVGKLVNLKSLEIYNNPLHSLDSAVMSKIGRSLTDFHFDMNHFTQWPHELHYLTTLQTLVVRYIPFPHLDINAFHGFENTLTYLELAFSKLEKVPYSICNLKHLKTFYFTFGTQLKENGSSIFEPCSDNLSRVATLYLSENGLHSFPDVFTVFPSLTSLYLDSNKLEYIDFALIPSNSSLTYINLDHNMFERIPSALNKFKSLQTLYIAYNNIKTLESADLYGLSMLNDLELNRNPIMYISPYALTHNLDLNTLDISDTNLDRIPFAVTYLPRLQYLQFSGKPIACTCDMSYLKHWNVTAVSNFNEFCASSLETIRAYIMHSLQSCA